MKQVFINTEENMKKCLNALSKEYIAIRAGRANPAVLDKILVDYYGAPTPINQLAAVSVTEARTLVIQPWDVSVLKEIEKAIQTSELGINPQNDGKIYALFFLHLQKIDDAKLSRILQRWVKIRKYLYVQFVAMQLIN